ncbi:MAG: ethylbenzene dehydrogenase-related protein [Nitrospirota bacterium]
MALCFALCAVIVLHASDASARGLVFLAKKVAGDLPLEAGDQVWETAEALEVPLSAQVMEKPRVYETSVEKLRIRAIHNSSDIAFLVEWEDETEDKVLDLDRFSDAAAVEFPSSAAKSKPHFAMGDDDNPVNIWYWKAAWQKDGVHEHQKAAEGEYAPRFYTADNHVLLDDFLPGVLAGNPVSTQVRSPVENIVASSFGSATDMEKSDNQDIGGAGKWDSGRWAVVFKRAVASEDKYDASFAEGRVTPVSFAVWDGSENHTGGRKSVSTWYFVGLETEEKATVYIYPMVAFLAALAIEAAIIMGIRKRRG